MRDVWNLRAGLYTEFPAGSIYLAQYVGLGSHFEDDSGVRPHIIGRGLACEGLLKESWRGNPAGAIAPEEGSRRRNPEGGILVEEPWRGNPGGRILEAESWKRNPRRRI